MRNRARRLECDTTIESVHRHDFQRCSCGAIFVDGGKSYNRFGFIPGKRYELLYDEDDDE